MVVWDKNPPPVGNRVKKIYAFHQPIINIFEEMKSGKEEMPEWIGTPRKVLPPENNITREAKNYRPLGCQNTLYKVYTSLLAHFVQDDCETNNIIAPEQAGGKRGTWSCIDQLLINKHLTNEVKHNRRNFLCAWLDYQKA